MRGFRYDFMLLYRHALLAQETDSFGEKKAAGLVTFGGAVEILGLLSFGSWQSS